MMLYKWVPILALGLLVFATPGQSEAQRRPAGQSTTASAQPKVSPQTSRKAVRDLRNVRNQLSGAQTLARQKLANAQTTLTRTRETERALGDTGLRESSREMRAAKARRLNAENTVRDFALQYVEARRQTKAANRTLSLAKKGDWVSANASAGLKNAVRPKPRLRKITFNDTPLGPSPQGSGARKGILKTRTR